ncbi:MAG: hypothetical protein K2H96_06110, partial [Muribaculaceae bacterium]|nr:hypothetical protein [Muribaculaceae bacterium]
MGCIRRLISICIVMSFAIVNSYAEKKDETWTKNLNVELSLNTSTPSKDNLPFSSILDVNYGLKRFSIHALVDGTYFLPKENITKNYNNTFNLGGGVGFEIFPRDINDPNIFEIRASVARSLGTSDYRNTAYKIGLQWLLKPNRR